MTIESIRHAVTPTGRALTGEELQEALACTDKRELQDLILVIAPANTDRRLADHFLALP